MACHVRRLPKTMLLAAGTIGFAADMASHAPTITGAGCLVRKSPNEKENSGKGKHFSGLGIHFSGKAKEKISRAEENLGLFFLPPS